MYKFSYKVAKLQHMLEQNNHVNYNKAYKVSYQMCYLKRGGKKDDH